MSSWEPRPLDGTLLFPFLVLLFDRDEDLEDGTLRLLAGASVGRDEPVLIRGLGLDWLSCFPDGRLLDVDVLVLLNPGLELLSFSLRVNCLLEPEVGLGLTLGAVLTRGFVNDSPDSPDAFSELVLCVLELSLGDDKDLPRTAYLDDFLVGATDLLGSSRLAETSTSDRSSALVLLEAGLRKRLVNERS